MHVPNTSCICAFAHTCGIARNLCTTWEEAVAKKSKWAFSIFDKRFTNLGWSEQINIFKHGFIINS